MPFAASLLKTQLAADAGITHDVLESAARVITLLCSGEASGSHARLDSVGKTRSMVEKRKEMEEGVLGTRHGMGCPDGTPAHPRAGDRERAVWRAPRARGTSFRRPVALSSEASMDRRAPKAHAETRGCGARVVRPRWAPTDSTGAPGPPQAVQIPCDRAGRAAKARGQGVRRRRKGGEGKMMERGR